MSIRFHLVLDFLCFLSTQLPQVAIFLKLEYARIPFVNINQRLKVEKYGSNERYFYHITARYGYLEHKIYLLDM